MDEKRFCAAEGDSGDADSVGRANGLPALASSSKERTKFCDSVIESHCKNRLSSFSLLMGNLA